ncbi:MAG: dihydropteroate synthase [Bacteroidales bacterium]|nr:dihydropteroate synthase [Bacteroidales bacterium]
MKPFALNIKGRLMSFDTPVVMAIINCTPDSFYSGSRCRTDEDILRKAETALQQGATILDIGGYSTRPDAGEIPEEEEWNRVEHALRLLTKAFPQAVLSIDTFRAGIAKRSVMEYGAHIVNDISAGCLDEQMFPTIARLHVPYIMMHMRGTPKTMQQQTLYTDLMAEMIDCFQAKIDRLHTLGVSDIIIDPGFGFAKTLEQNYMLLRKMPQLQILDCPVLAGLSRKSMIYKLLGCTPQDALNGTTAANMLALQNGAAILRVHDVLPAVEAIRIYRQYIQ